MSTKQFISAEEHLAKLGVTVQQVQDFISANVDQPSFVFFELFNAGVTRPMISEITNISTTGIDEYFEAAGLESEKLDRTSMLTNHDLGPLEKLVDFNHNTGVLSNAALRDVVRSSVDSANRYDDSFKYVIGIEDADGIYDAEELGVGHLIDVPATSDSVESLFYGSLINMFRAIDETELEQINAFPDDGNTEDFQVLLVDALSETPDNVFWTEGQLAELVSTTAIKGINCMWNSSSAEAIDVVGVLDSVLIKYFDFTS
jgi:hypothetical protein